MTDQVLRPIQQVITSPAGVTAVLNEPTLDTPWGPIHVPQAIYDKYRALSAQRTADGTMVQTYLGWPLRLATGMGGCTAVYFERGIIVLRSDGSCFVVYGAIYVRYAMFGDINPSGWSPGLPIADEEAVTNGRRSRFDGADIYWSGSTDAREVHGAIRDHWQALGGVAGFLGYPLTDETSVQSNGNEIGRMNLFQGGSIYWSPGSGAFEVHGDLRQAWLTRYGGPTGPLGWPVSDETSSPSGALRYNDFQNGCLVWPGNYDGIRMLTSVDVFVERIDSKGSRGVGETLGVTGVWLYVNTSVTTSTGLSASPRLPASDHYGANATPDASLLTIAPVRGGMTIDVSLDGWDAMNIGSDQELGRITGHFTIDDIVNNPGPFEGWAGDFYAAYSIRNQTPTDPMDPNFRQDLFWGFRNFQTAMLTREQFGQTFTDVQGDESGWHPFDDLFYNNVYKTIAANGNCFGMCLEANDTLARRSLYSEPLHAVPDAGTAEGEINIKHGYQVGAGVIDYMVGKVLTGGIHDPVRCFNESRAMYESNDFPIISVSRDFIGGPAHAVRPYRWDQSNPNDWLIYIANPNEPAPAYADGAPQNVIHVDPHANRFTFQFYEDARPAWTGDGSSGGLMFALPFSIMCDEPRTPFWEALAALIGASMLIIAGDAQAQQITDDVGHTFYGAGLTGAPSSWDDLNNDDASRIPNMARIPIHARVPLNPAALRTDVAAGVAGVGGAAGSAAEPVSNVGAGIAVNPGVLTNVDPLPTVKLPEVYRLHGTQPFGPPPSALWNVDVTRAAQDVATSAVAAASAAGPTTGTPDAGASPGTPAGTAVSTVPHALTPGMLRVLGPSAVAAAGQSAQPAQPAQPVQTSPQAGIDLAKAAGSGALVAVIANESRAPGQLNLQLVNSGSGNYSWGVRSAGASVVANVPAAAGAADQVSIVRPGATDQAVSLTLDSSAPARQAQLTLVGSVEGGPDNIRVFLLSNVQLTPGQPLSAQLSTDGGEILIQNAGPQATLQLEIRAGLGGVAAVSRPSVTLEAGKVSVIRPDTWDPAQLPNATVSLDVMDAIGGKVLSQTTVQ